MNLLLIAGWTARRLLSRRKTILLVLLAATPALFGLVFRRFGPPGGDDPFDVAVPSFFVLFLCPIVPLFFAASVLRDAVEDRTATFILTTPTSRTAFAFGSFLGLIPPMLLLLTGAVVAAFAAWRGGLDAWWTPEGGLPTLLNLVAVSWAGGVVYAALYTLLGLLVKWPTVVGVVYYSIVELTFGFLAGAPRKIGLASKLEALLLPPWRTWAADVLQAQASSDVPPTPREAALHLAVACAIFLALLAWRARRADFVDESSAR